MSVAYGRIYVSRVLLSVPTEFVHKFYLNTIDTYWYRRYVSYEVLVLTMLLRVAQETVTLVVDFNLITTSSYVRTYKRYVISAFLFSSGISTVPYYEDSNRYVAIAANHSSGPYFGFFICASIRFK